MTRTAQLRRGSAVAATALAAGLAAALASPLGAAALDDQITLLGSYSSGPNTYFGSVNPSTDELWVTNWSSGSASAITVLDGTSGAPIATVPTGRATEEIVFDESANIAYAFNRNDSSVTIVDGSTHAVLDTVTIPGSVDPTHADIDDVNGLIYVTDDNNDELLVLDLSGALVAQIPTAPEPFSVAVDEQSDQVFIGYSSDRSYAVYDIAAGTLGAPIALTGGQVSDYTYDVALDPNSRRVYFGGYGAPGNVWSVDADTGLQVDWWSVPDGDGDLTVLAGSGLVFVGNCDSGFLSTVDTGTGEVTSIDLGGSGFICGVASNSATRTVYGLDAGTNQAHYLGVTWAPTPGSMTIVLPAAGQGTAYSASVAVDASPLPTYAVTSGALPAGLTLDPATGVISGTPTVGGSFAFTVTATNAQGTAATSYTLAVAGTAAAAAAKLPDTGADATTPMLLALGLLAVGAAATVVSSRRRRSAQR